MGRRIKVKDDDIAKAIGSDGIAVLQEYGNHWESGAEGHLSVSRIAASLTWDEPRVVRACLKLAEHGLIADYSGFVVMPMGGRFIKTTIHGGEYDGCDYVMSQKMLEIVNEQLSDMMRDGDPGDGDYYWDCESGEPNSNGGYNLVRGEPRLKVITFRVVADPT